MGSDEQPTATTPPSTIAARMIKLNPIAGLW